MATATFELLQRCLDAPATWTFDVSTIDADLAAFTSTDAVACFTLRQLQVLHLYSARPIHEAEINEVLRVLAAILAAMRRFSEQEARTWASRDQQILEAHRSHLSQVVERLSVDLYS